MKTFLQVIMILIVIIAPLAILKPLADAPIKDVTTSIVCDSALEGYCKIKRIEICPAEKKVVANLVDM